MVLIAIVCARVAPHHKSNHSLVSRDQDNIAKARNQFIAKQLGC